MSMNFGREMSLLRVRFTEAGTPEHADAKKAATGSAATFLGAADDEVETAAREVVENFPQMGRAQMTAFVRTLWQSNTYELQMAAAHILAARAELLEPPDFAFVEGLLKKCDADELATLVAGEALGTLTGKNKKLWRDLKKMAKAADSRLRRAAIRACRIPVIADEALFSRLQEIVEPLLEQSDEDEDVLATIDGLLAAIAEHHADAANELAKRHGRPIKS